MLFARFTELADTAPRPNDTPVTPEAARVHLRELESTFAAMIRAPQWDELHPDVRDGIGNTVAGARVALRMAERCDLKRREAEMDPGA